MKRKASTFLELLNIKYVTMAKQQNPLLFNDGRYPPHSMRHSTASHMLEAGVPLAVIKNFLGHASLQSTQIYADISQHTMDRHLQQWSEQWFTVPSNAEQSMTVSDEVPNFLI